MSLQQIVHRIVTLSSFIILLTAPLVQAESVAVSTSSTMPAAATTELRTILSNQEFQPRERPVKFSERVMHYIGMRAQEFLHAVKEWLHEMGLAVEATPDSWWGSILRSLKSFLRTLGDGISWIVMTLSSVVRVGIVVLLVGGALYYGVRVTKKRGVRSNDAPLGLTPLMAVHPTPTLSALLEAGEFKHALVVLRKKLRESLEARYDYARSMSDRAVSAQIPLTDPEYELFSYTAHEFEQCAFKGDPLHVEEIKHLCRLYEAR